MMRLRQDTLVVRFLYGDGEAFEQAWQVHLPRLLGEIHRVTVDYDDVQELLQRTRVEAYRARHSYSGAGDVGAWLTGICRHCCLRWIRAAQRRRKRASDFQVLAEVIKEPEVEVDAFEAEYEGRCQRAAQALARLTPRQRKVVLLRSVERRSVADVAEQLQCSLGTVKATYHQALAHLRAELADTEPDMQTDDVD